MCIPMDDHQNWQPALQRCAGEPDSTHSVDLISEMYIIPTTIMDCTRLPTSIVHINNHSTSSLFCVEGGLLIVGIAPDT